MKHVFPFMAQIFRVYQLVSAFSVGSCQDNRMWGYSLFFTWVLASCSNTGISGHDSIGRRGSCMKVWKTEFKNGTELFLKKKRAFFDNSSTAKTTQESLSQTTSNLRPHQETRQFWKQWKQAARQVDCSCPSVYWTKSRKDMVLDGEVRLLLLCHIRLF